MDGLFSAAMPIPSHTGLARLAVVIGGAQLVLTKGTSVHRLLGWLWVTLMTYVAISSFFISTIQTWRGFSPIHLLSVWTLLSLVIGVYHARAGNIRQHQRWMVTLYVLALLVTGLLTLWPGRLMHHAVFGV